MPICIQLNNNCLWLALAGYRTRNSQIFVKFLLICALICFLFSRVQAEEKLAPLRSIQAARIEKPPVIDGLLDDLCWQQADWQGNFIQLRPYPGSLPAP